VTKRQGVVKTWVYVSIDGVKRIARVGAIFLGADLGGKIMKAVLDTSLEGIQRAIKYADKRAVAAALQRYAVRYNLRAGTKGRGVS
jgi:hypothetical protein